MGLGPQNCEGEGMRKPLSETDLLEAVASLPKWKLVEGELVQALTFKDFVQAMEFVNHAAALAEAANHHPDIDIRYNKVRLALVTHDAGGITHNDIEMAKKLDALLTN
jgi:4a-hydroxytetrahydrobiopterin dehydratase